MRDAELLLDAYDRIGHDARNSLRDGLSKRELISAYTCFLKLPHPVERPLFPKALPDELLGLYCWHDGDGSELIPYFRFTSFASALESWDITSESAEDSVMYENGNAVFADTSAFPFLNLNNSDYIVMDVGDGSPTRGSIGQFVATGCSTVRNEFETLSQFFRAHAQCCKDGIYSVGEHGLDFNGERTSLERFRTNDIRTANGASIGL